MRNQLLRSLIALTTVIALLSIALPGMAQVPGGTLDPIAIPKYLTPLVIPPAMPSVGHGANFTFYQIAAKQFQQQVLPIGFPTTTVWGYGSAIGPDPGKPGSTYHWPSYTVEARTNETVRVRWINGLVDKRGNYLPHLLPVDPTLHWANPPGPPDMQPMFESTPGPYTGPVPIVTHVHGAHVPAISDGYPEAWYLPNAKDIPAGYFKQGTHYGSVLPAPPGSALFEYPNDQRATTLWYHDHALGITRLNVYAGLAGFWLLRDDVEDSLNLPGPAPKTGDKPGTRYYEIPLAIQDRSFNQDGSLFFPDNRAFFEGLNVPGKQPQQFPGEPSLDIPFVPEAACEGPSDISPIWNPEFFGNTMVVNGNTWPYLNVEPRQYRFRMLNGTNARFLILKLINGNNIGAFEDGQVIEADRPFYQIGSEGGLLPNEPVELETLLVAPAERPDVIVDFSDLKPGDVLYLINEGPDEPFGGGRPDEDFDRADPLTTGQIMKFVVVPLQGQDKSTPASQLELPAIERLRNPDRIRDLSLNEESSETVLVSTDEDENVVLDCENGEPFGPRRALLGTMEDGVPNPLPWMAPITENPSLNSVEDWAFHNFTMDAHPIHLHQVMFQVIGRAPIGEADEINPEEFSLPEPWETGWKDTVIAYPDQITYVRAKFDLPGLYVWHCHILNHEDNEMMRPYYVGSMPQGQLAP